MSARSFLEQDLQRRLARLELIFSQDFMAKLTSVIKTESGIDDDLDNDTSLDKQKYYNCLGQLYDFISDYCEKNHIKEVDYIYKGKQIPHGFVFFYQRSETGEIEYYFISFIAGQGVQHFCFQLFDEWYQSNAIDIEKVLNRQAYQLEELKKALAKLQEHYNTRERYNELLKQCSEAHDFIQSKQRKMWERLFSGTVYDTTISRKIQYERLEDVHIEEEAIHWIERIILPALKEEAIKTLFQDDGKVKIYVCQRLDTYELNVCNSQKQYMNHFGKARIIQEHVYYGKYGEVIMDKAVELLAKMKNDGNLVTGRKDEIPHSWVFECPVVYESY